MGKGPGKRQEGPGLGSEDSRPEGPFLGDATSIWPTGSCEPVGPKGQFGPAGEQGEDLGAWGPVREMLPSPSRTWLWSEPPSAQGKENL